MTRCSPRGPGRRAYSPTSRSRTAFATAAALVVFALPQPEPLVIEAARSSLTHDNQPAFAEVFDGMRGK